MQSTSVPGVAQRTGSTSYYIEIGEKGTQPVFALVPMPGRVDLVIASELSEAGRMLERGFVSPKRTTLITSTSRVLTTAEKMQMGDGRFPSEKILTAGEALAARFIAFDLEAIARDCGTIVSAPMFGALAGTGLLPWGREACEAVMGKGRGATASLKGFAQAFAMAAQGGKDETPEPPATVDVLALGSARCADYMDAVYAALFVERVVRLKAAAGGDDPLRSHALEEATRRLALWMTYEDIPRVADLKIRPERFDRIRAEAQMTSGQVLQVTDLLKPGLEEVAAMLPAPLGHGLLAYQARGGRLPFLGKGLHLHTTSLMGITAFRILAWMGRFRRHSLRFQQEDEAITLWLDLMVQALPVAPSFAGALAELPRLLKGYGETQARDWQIISGSSHVWCSRFSPAG